MARKTTGRQAAKSPTGRQSFSTLQRLEKEFKDTPNRLSAQLSKEIKTLKATESKLKTSSAKLKAKIKTLESRFKTTNKTKNTTAGKKQLLATKKLHATTLKSQTALTKQLKDNAGLLQTASAKQAKFIALKKHLSQFERDWAANAKKMKPAKAKTTVKKTKKKTEAAQASYDKLPYENQQSQNPHQKTFDENIRIDDTEEVTS